MTRAAASDAKSAATRTGLKSGFKATADSDAPDKKEVLSESKFQEKLEEMKKDVANAGSGPQEEPSDKAEISPVTEAAAATLDENKNIVDTLPKKTV